MNGMSDLPDNPVEDRALPRVRQILASRGTLN
jgi:hypothetical protein